MNEGQDVVGVRYGFGGLARGDVWDLNWMDVQNWIAHGRQRTGCDPPRADRRRRSARSASRSRQWDIRGFIAVGGLATYEQVVKLMARRASVTASCASR